MSRAAALLLLFLAAACSNRFEVPIPAVGQPTAAPPPVEPASLALPVVISMARLRDEIGLAWPAADSLDRERCLAMGGLVCHQYVYRRDSLELRMQSDRIALFTQIRYRARIALPGVGSVASCGYAPEPMKRATARLTTTLFWRSDWRLGARATQLDAELPDPCAITMLRVDATPLVRRIIDAQLGRVREEIERALPAAADLRPAADSLWRLLQQPVSLDTAGSAWLAMMPATVGVTPISGTATSVATSIVLTARPRIVVGERPATVVRPLPPLALARAARGIRVPLEIELPFAEIGRRATALVAGEVAGKGITIGAIQVWGVGDTAVVRVGVTGRVSGSLYLLGRVAFDSTTREVLVQDLRFTLASDNAMSRIKASLGAGRIRSALDSATGHGRLDIGQQLDSLRAQLTVALNRDLAPGVSLRGGVTDVRVLGFLTTPTAFLLRVTVIGDAVVLAK